ncbi:DMT family transporter [Muricoccus pecuniae]|uniref:Drug/metabolite transporter (DMT)-like permease n=1 Tax=Muricoccus pecuniae TaxID=693023 RepID=A0A840YEB3_9PROT|nr:DMT family transporter [Roseomonas pecuniae]MBB5694521.1 drug/metabolite transporter (DMT)-like permease [Roseomonas pecuniae]
MLAAYAQLAGSMILTGANVAVAKALAAALPVPLILGLRCLIACAVLLPLALWRDGVPRARGAVLWNLLLQAATGTVLYNAALLAGLRHTTALEGGLVLATMPAVVALGSALWLRESVPPRGWAAVVLAAGGMAAIVLARGGGGEGSALGNALIFLGVCGEAAYVLLAKRAAGALPLLTASLWMQGFSAALILPAWLPEAGATARLADPFLLILLVLHALTASVFSLLLWYGGLRRATAGTAGVLTAFLPATAAVTAILFLGEVPTLAHALGFALLLASILLATWPERSLR